MKTNAANHSQTKITATYILVCLLAVLFTFLFHELSHWLAGSIQGHNMGMSLNGVFNAGQLAITDHEQILISAAGPAFTILQAVMVYVLIKRSSNVFLYPFLFTPCYMRLLATGLNLIHLNDEGVVGYLLGIGVYTIGIAVTILLGMLVYYTSKRERYSIKFNMQTLALIIAFSSALILCDMFIKIRLI